MIITTVTIIVMGMVVEVIVVMITLFIAKVKTLILLL